MDSTTGHVLVVDDEVDNIRFLGRLLDRQGFEVHAAESGQSALVVADRLAGNVRIDLVLLDILMPGAVDGIEACRRLKSRPEMRDTPVIFLTAADDREIMVRAFEAGGADYVLKPFNIEVLLARVRTHARLGQLSHSLQIALDRSTRELREANAQLRRLAMEVSLVEEREKKRLAGELHDSPMQKLALAQIQIASAEQRQEEESTRLIGSGLELIRGALRELRTLQFELSPPVLYREGLAAALSWLASSMAKRFGVRLDFVQGGSLPDIDQDLAVLLFKCTRELAHNLVRHAEASSGSIELESCDGEASIVVSDDGKGIPGALSEGYGLLSIRERLALLGGDLFIESCANGTRASIRIPLHRGDE